MRGPQEEHTPNRNVGFSRQMKLLILIRETQRYDFVRFRLAAAAPVRFTNRNVDVPRARLTFANWKFEFRGV